MMHGSWEIERSRQNFLPFFSTNNSKNQNFEKMKGRRKKKPGGIIILHKCPKNHDHMLYCSWDMECDRCNCGDVLEGGEY